jgi:hypothetical protein
MTAEEIPYRGYRLIVEPLGSDWRVTVYPSGADRGHRDQHDDGPTGASFSQHTGDLAGRNRVIQRARNLVDGLIVIASSGSQHPGLGPG